MESPDVTESKAQALDRLPIGVMQVQDGGIVFMNRLAQGLFGPGHRTLEDIIGNRSDFDTAFRSPMGTQLRWINIDGSLFNVDIRGTKDARTILLIPDEYSKISDQDVMKLKQSYNDFVEIFENSFDGIYVANGNGITEWMNRGFERCYGVSARDFIGRDAQELEKRGYLDHLVTWRIITTKKPVTTLQKTRDGKRVLVTGIPLFDDNGNVRKVIINSRDTTDLIQLRERLDLAEKNIAKYESEIDRLRAGNVKPGGLVWASEKMGDVLALAKRVAEVDTTLLITGESGVGKEAIAQFIHNESPRRNGPFSQINCGAIPEQLLESELFGYEPGAFTGAPGKGKPGLIELAEKGTLFLDEIGDLPLTLQVKFLRVLQDKTLTRLGSVKKITVDCRIMAATNRDIRQQVKDKRFREDLYYRLSVVPIEVPPLRERPEEIAPMALKFLQEFNGIYAQEKKLSENAIGKLVRYAWPGNVRELRNLIERLVVTVDGLTIGGDMIPPEIAPTEPEIQNAHSYRDKVLSYEADLLAEAMKQCGSIRKTAKFLEISESTIKRKLRAARAAIVDRP